MAMADDALIARIVERVRSLLDALLAADEEAAAGGAAARQLYSRRNGLVRDRRPQRRTGAGGQPAPNRDHRPAGRRRPGGGRVARAERGRKRRYERLLDVPDPGNRRVAGSRHLARVRRQRSGSRVDPRADRAVLHRRACSCRCGRVVPWTRWRRCCCHRCSRRVSGLHVIERGVHLWRTFRAEAPEDLGDAAGWAAGLSLAIDLLDGREPDPGQHRRALRHPTRSRPNPLRHPALAARAAGGARAAQPNRRRSLPRAAPCSMRPVVP